MSSAERFVRHHKQQTDRAISHAYKRLTTDGCASATFTELLYSVRKRATPLLEAPIVDARHPGIDALVNLSRFTSAHVRSPHEWSGSRCCWLNAVASLAQHLLGRYTVPPFLAASWYAIDDPFADRKREWYIAHGRGQSFRSLDLPIVMTRKMEHIFLKSQAHLPIEQAIRRAELLALGATDELVRAVLSTRLAVDLRNGEFWRTVWIFLAANAAAIHPSQVGPMIDFIDAIRHERVAVETPDGIVTRDPPQPAFSMKGRTVRSLLRLVEEWHGGLAVGSLGRRWPPSPLEPMLFEEPNDDPSGPPSVWQLTELTSDAELRAEGAALHHCVASYADRCWRGTSRIWSLRVRRRDKVRHLLTIEVDLKKRAVVQARGWRNRPPSGKPLRLLQEWTIREKLQGPL